MGSINTTVVKNEEGLKQLMSNQISTGVDGPIDLEVENFAKGEMYHCDGLVYENQVKLAWVSKYINTCVGFLDSNFLASYTLQKDNPLVPRITDFTIKTLHALNQYDSENNPSLSYSFHVEVFYDESTSDIVLCEAACRTGFIYKLFHFISFILFIILFIFVLFIFIFNLFHFIYYFLGGAGVSDVNRYMWNVDLNKACVQSQCGDKPNSEGIPEGDYTTQKRAEDTKQCVGWLLMYPKVGTIKTLANGEAFEFVYSQSNSSRRSFLQMAHCTDCISQFIITGNDEKDVIKNIKDTARWFTENTIYD